MLTAILKTFFSLVQKEGGFPGGSDGKESACQWRRHRRHGFDPWIRKIPEGGNGNPLQYSSLENPMDRGACRLQSMGSQELDMIQRLNYNNKYRLVLAIPVFLSGSDGKESACNQRDLGSIPGSGRSPGKRNGNPLQYSSLKNSMNRGAWWATVHGVAKS